MNSITKGANMTTAPGDMIDDKPSAMRLVNSTDTAMRLACFGMTQTPKIVAGMADSPIAADVRT
ncbi:MAG: hypothetical protein ACPG77_19340, partial [Nannocystaceae bacterium]